MLKWHFGDFTFLRRISLFKLVHDSHDRDKSHGKLTLKLSQPESRRKSQNILRIGSMTFKYTEVMSLNKKNFEPSLLTLCTNKYILS